MLFLGMIPSSLCTVSNKYQWQQRNKWSHWSGFMILPSHCKITEKACLLELISSVTIAFQENVPISWQANISGFSTATHTGVRLWYTYLCSLLPPKPQRHELSSPSDLTFDRKAAVVVPFWSLLVLAYWLLFRFMFPLQQAFLLCPFRISQRLVSFLHRSINLYSDPGICLC